MPGFAILGFGSSVLGFGGFQAFGFEVRRPMKPNARRDAGLGLRA